jgi:hypothetical protein
MTNCNPKWLYNCHSDNHQNPIIYKLVPMKHFFGCHLPFHIRKFHITTKCLLSYGNNNFYQTCMGQTQLVTTLGQYNYESLLI